MVEIYQWTKINDKLQELKIVDSRYLLYYVDETNVWQLEVNGEKFEYSENVDSIKEDVVNRLLHLAKEAKATAMFMKENS